MNIILNETLHLKLCGQLCNGFCQCDDGRLHSCEALIDFSKNNTFDFLANEPIVLSKSLLHVNISVRGRHDRYYLSKAMFPGLLINVGRSVRLEAASERTGVDIE